MDIELQLQDLQMLLMDCLGLGLGLQMLLMDWLWVMRWQTFQIPIHRLPTMWNEAVMIPYVVDTWYAFTLAFQSHQSAQSHSAHTEPSHIRVPYISFQSH